MLLLFSVHFPSPLLLAIVSDCFQGCCLRWTVFFYDVSCKYQCVIGSPSLIIGFAVFMRVDLRICVLLFSGSIISVFMLQLSLLPLLSVIISLLGAWFAVSVELFFPGEFMVLFPDCFDLPLPNCIVAAKSKLSVDVFRVLESCSSTSSISSDSSSSSSPSPVSSSVVGGGF